MHQQARHAKGLLVKAPDNKEHVVGALQTVWQGSWLQLHLSRPCIKPFISALSWRNALDRCQVVLALLHLWPFVPEQRKRLLQLPRVSEVHRSRMHEIWVASLSTEPACQIGLTLPCYCKNKLHKGCERQAFSHNKTIRLEEQMGLIFCRLIHHCSLCSCTNSRRQYQNSSLCWPPMPIPSSSSGSCTIYTPSSMRTSSRSAATMELAVLAEDRRREASLLMGSSSSLSSLSSWLDAVPDNQQKGAQL